MSSTLTDLTAATSWSGTDLFYATIGSNSRKIAASNFFTLASNILSTTKSIAADVGFSGSAVPILDLSQIWNAAVVHRTVRITAADSSSSAGSRALEIVVAEASTKYALAVVSTTGSTSPVTAIAANGTLDTVLLRLISGIAWGSTFASPDITFVRESAGVVSQVSGTTSQVSQLYHTFTDASNYERLTLYKGSGGFEIASQSAGTGADDLDLRLVPAGAGNVRFFPGVATPAAGSTTARVTLGSTSGFGIYIGSGVPTVSASQGSLYLRSDGSSTSTRLYVNTGGAWTNITSAT